MKEQRRTGRKHDPLMHLYRWTQWWGAPTNGSFQSNMIGSTPRIGSALLFCDMNPSITLDLKCTHQSTSDISFRLVITSHELQRVLIPRPGIIGLSFTDENGSNADWRTCFVR